MGGNDRYNVGTTDHVEDIVVFEEGWKLRRDSLNIEQARDHSELLQIRPLVYTQHKQTHCNLMTPTCLLRG